jgi:hypothetical protein
MDQFLYRILFFFIVPVATIAASSPTTHTIRVGFNGNFAFDPDTVYADVNDTVIFDFFPTNHSVVRGEYTGSEACGTGGGCNPCVPYELIHPDKQGFNSGNFLTQNVSVDGNVAFKPISSSMRKLTRQ